MSFLSRIRRTGRKKSALEMREDAVMSLARAISKNMRYQFSKKNHYLKKTNVKYRRTMQKYVDETAANFSSGNYIQAERCFRLLMETFESEERSINSEKASTERRMKAFKRENEREEQIVEREKQEIERRNQQLEQQEQTLERNKDELDKA